MSYFKKIDDYQTYRGDEFDFHLDYNANSGGGQAFLGGAFRGSNGEAASPKELEGKNAAFIFRFHSLDGSCLDVDLGTDDSYCYPISPRGSGSQQMKLGLGGGKVRPSLLLPAAMMLPETTTINMAASLDLSPLTKGNYWLRSMQLECEFDDGDMVRFVPKDYVFSGGLSKQNGYATEDGRPTGNAVFFRLDYATRANDIIYLAEKQGQLMRPIGEIMCFFQGVLTGTVPFDHKKCYAKTAEIMRLLAHEYPTVYSGIEDPLPMLMEIIGSAHNRKRLEMPKTMKANEPRNLIYFGAPGTGKSYQLDKKAEALFDEGKMVCATFYPDYTYAQFVGCYKPHAENDSEKKVTYKFIPGPFLKVYLNAITHPEEQYLLKIEELNRANPAAVFGDVFQLLDRDENGNSEYNVEASIDMGNCIGEFFDKLSDEEKEALESYYDDLGFEGVRELLIEHLSIPSNMYIWATMNSADQGVFPMDTAFKRRWDFRYMDIDAGADVLSDYIVALGETGKRVRWNDLRVGINNVLRRANINEDKWLGPFFIKPDVLKDGQAFLNAFKDKVLLYLYEDAAKSKPGKVFADKSMTYSEVCKTFMAEGVAVFSEFDEGDIEYLPADADDVAADEGETLEG